jgi:tetratricopeptide (TPR) repeat protein
MRAAVAALCCTLALGAAAQEAQRPLQVGPLVQRAEAALSRGDAAAALVNFEAAAEQAHAQDIELGIVRSRMQQGEYRRALAFCAHAAGAHRDEPEGTLLYATLLRLGGQPEQAKRTLDEAGLAATGSAFGPSASGDAVPVQARLLATGLLIDTTHALVPLASLGGATTVWLRDGLGRTVRAQVQRRTEALALLRLDRPLDAPALTLPPRDAFAGAPAHAVTYSDSAPSWPALHTGFLAMAGLGIEMPGAARGGPVFDAQGRLAGIALRVDGRDRLLPASAMRELLPELSPTINPTPSPRLPLDELYERALRVTLQVLGAADSSKGNP